MTNAPDVGRYVRHNTNGAILLVIGAKIYQNGRDSGRRRLRIIQGSFGLDRYGKTYKRGRIVWLSKYSLIELPQHEEMALKLLGVE